FIAASLLKVPLAIKIYELKNEGRFSLNDTVTIEPSDLDKKFGTLWQKGAGTKLTIREAVEHMVQESDDTAVHVLTRKIESARPSAMDEVFDDLDIPKE